MSEVPKTTKQFEAFANKLESMAPDPYQSVRETTDAMATDYMARLRSLVQQNRSRNKPYVIQVLARRDLPLENALHITFVVRHSLPLPDWETSVYEIDNKEGSVKLWWALPTEVDAKQIVKRGELFDDKLYDDCKLVLESEDDPTRRFVPMVVNL